jgi:hypothetical protein
MTEPKFGGRTRAEWLSFQDKIGKLGCPPEVDIYRAKLFFEAEDRSEQMNETRKQFRVAQGIAALAVAISILGWIFPRAARESNPNSVPNSPAFRLPPTNTATALLPPLTNALPSTTPK